MSLDMKTGLPANYLQRTDFELLDNNHPVTIKTFDSGAKFDTTAVALWLIVICNEASHVPGHSMAASQDVRSGTFTGHEATLRPALSHLDQRDRVGVAHWCDNGDARIDLPPDRDRDLAIGALQQTLMPSGFDETRISDMRHGALACQRMVRLILDNAHETSPSPLPVFVFLHSDWTGMPRDELDALVNEILETSGVVFGIKDSHVAEMGQLRFEQGAIFHYLAQETGGQYFSVPADQYSTALEAILLQLHFRYQLGFRPMALDGNRHKLTVRFTLEARKKYKSVRLRSRPEYIPKP